MSPISSGLQSNNRIEVSVPLFGELPITLVNCTIDATTLAPHVVELLKRYQDLRGCFSEEENAVIDSADIMSKGQLKGNGGGVMYHEQSGLTALCHVSNEKGLVITYSDLGPGAQPIYLALTRQFEGNALFQLSSIKNRPEAEPELILKLAGGDRFSSSSAEINLTRGIVTIYPINEIITLSEAIDELEKVFEFIDFKALGITLPKGYNSEIMYKPYQIRFEDLPNVESIIDLARDFIVQGKESF